MGRVYILITGLKTLTLETLSGESEEEIGTYIEESNENHPVCWTETRRRQLETSTRPRRNLGEEKPDDHRQDWRWG